MAVLLANDFPILSARITFPRVGVWSALVHLDGDDELSGAVVVSSEDASVSWNATVARGGSFLGRASYVLQGGAAALGTIVTPKFYQGSPLRLPVQDLLLAVGEVLSPLSDQESLNTLLPKWAPTEQSAGSLLTQLCSNVDGLIWRALPSGEVWICKDSFAAFTGDYVLLSEDLEANKADFDLDLPLLFPGVSIEGKNVSRVIYDLSASQFSTRVFYEL